MSKRTADIVIRVLTGLTLLGHRAGRGAVHEDIFLRSWRGHHDRGSTIRTVDAIVSV